MKLPILLLAIFFKISASNDIDNCPKDCFCQLQHWKELPVIQYIKFEEEVVDKAHYLYTNEAIQFDDISVDNPLTKVVICILQSNDTLKKQIEDLPEDLEALTFIQSSDDIIDLNANNLSHLPLLKILEIKGSEKFKNKLKFVLDVPLKDLSYINLENIDLEGTNVEVKTLEEKFDEALQKLQFTSLVKNETEPVENIVPYEVYKEEERRKKLPMFKGHENLILLRINGCKLQEIIWEMFDQLTKLRCLYLENNDLKIIPPFAFYSLPKLQILSLAKNHLLDINVSDLSGLLELEYLDLSSNNFSQLSELSFPPFPKLKLADFRNNPITTIYSNTFEVMNTTKSIVLGNTNTQITLTQNAFSGLNQLEMIKIYNLKIGQLNREILFGMKNLKELHLTGEIKQIEFDTFVDVKQLETLILNHCNLIELSMDSFIGSRKLQILDLSFNQLTSLPLGIFDSLSSIREILLNNNQLTDLPQGIFYKISAKMIRLNNNPWDCTCNLMHWSASLINRIKIQTPKQCRHDYDKGISCENAVTVIRYIYDRRVAPICSTPKIYANKGVFQAIKKMNCHQNLRKQKLTKKVIDYMMNNTVTNSKNLNMPNSILINRKKNLKKIKKIKTVYVSNNVVSDNNIMDNSL